MPETLRRLRLGTRPSRLAYRQAREIQERFPGISFEVVLVATPGDRDKATPLSLVTAGDYFTRDLEEALRRGVIDAAVHSAKDLEERIPDDLAVAALTRPVDAREALVARQARTLKELLPGAVVGTSSIRRREQVRRLRPDVCVKDIRGDIDERIAQVESGRYDAVVMAYAALLRLGHHDKAAEVFSQDKFEPHPLQGRLAVQVRRDRRDLMELFGRIDEP